MSCREIGVLVAIVAIAFLLALAATWYVYTVPGFANSTNQADLVTTLFDAYEAILVGLIVGVLGILVPNFYGQARDRFEHERKARQALSEVETGIDYLPGIIASAKDLSEAYLKLESLQVMKHVALTYKPELEKLLEDKEVVSPEEWGHKSYLFLVATECELQVHAKDWNTKPADERIIHLRNAHTAGSKLYDVTTMEARTREDTNKSAEELRKVAGSESADTEAEGEAKPLWEEWKNPEIGTHTRINLAKDLYRLYRYHSVSENLTRPKI